MENDSFNDLLNKSFICQDDPDTLLKCLTIASEMLQGVATRGLNPTLTTLVQTLVIFSFFHHDNN